MSTSGTSGTGNGGRYFEDFALGEVIQHATPRTISAGDVALYTALYGPRFAVQSGASFAQAVGYPHSPVDDLLVFHVVFGKSVPDISLNAVANLGYADCRFLQPVFPGDTLSAHSKIIGLRENRNGKSGIVYLRTQGFNHEGAGVLDYVRWVMVLKADPESAGPEPSVPELPEAVSPDALGTACPVVHLPGWDNALSGSARRFGDYGAGEKIDHAGGVTVEEAEHMMAARLYQNTARVHFNLFAQKDTRFGRRLIYGGHVISIARALSFTGLENAFHVAAINGGAHVAPLFTGGTVFAWSEVLETAALPDRDDVGALRLRTIATVDRACGDFPGRTQDGHEDGVILDLDYWALMPR